jgi:hypothetical protein
MFDRGDSSFECLIADSSLECLIEDTALCPLSNIQGCCLLYQTFKVAVSSIKHSRLLSPLSNIQDCCLIYQAFKAAVSSQPWMFDRGDSSLECLIEETVVLNV